MKNKFKALVNPLWQILTDVPGWPDAPRKLRIKRLLPIALPVVVTLTILLWNLAWRAPQIRSVRTAHQPFIALEQEVADLRLTMSEQQATETAARAVAAGQVLLAQPNQLPSTLDRLRDLAPNFGWSAVFTPTTPPTPPSPAEAHMYFLPVKGKLSPSIENSQPFASLLAFLEKMTATDRWVDLTRLSLRADEQGKRSVELFLRIGCRVPDEKTP
ncbi:MAG: hypothetical protein QM790_02375 [Nibricoccus sp.]